MGDRCNVFVVTEEDGSGVYLYGHWSGHDLGPIVAAALKRGKGRWTDPPYLARIVFSEMIQGSVLDETGFGISTRVCDNGRPIIVLDPRSRTASVTSIRDDSAFVEIGESSREVTNTTRMIPFAQLAEMDDDTARAWHLGREVAQ